MSLSPSKPLELVCPAGNLPSLKIGVDHGADAVYLGFRDETNARHFLGLNFDAKTAAQGVWTSFISAKRFAPNGVRCIPRIGWIWPRS